MRRHSRILWQCAMVGMALVLTLIPLPVRASGPATPQDQDPVAIATTGGTCIQCAMGDDLPDGCARGCPVTLGLIIENRRNYVLTVCIYRMLTVPSGDPCSTPALIQPVTLEVPAHGILTLNAPVLLKMANSRGSFLATVIVVDSPERGDIGHTAQSRSSFIYAYVTCEETPPQMR